MNPADEVLDALNLGFEAGRARWAVCRIAKRAGDPSWPQVVEWPIGAGDVHLYALLHGPFDSDIDAGAMLLVHVGAYPDDPAGIAGAAAFVRRVRTRAQALNAYVAENAPQARRDAPLVPCTCDPATVPAVDVHTAGCPRRTWIASAAQLDGPPAEAVAAAKASFGATVLPAEPYRPPTWHDATAAQIVRDRP